MGGLPPSPSSSPACGRVKCRVPRAACRRPRRLLVSGHAACPQCRCVLAASRPPAGLPGCARMGQPVHEHELARQGRALTWQASFGPPNPPPLLLRARALSLSLSLSHSLSFRLLSPAHPHPPPRSHPLDPPHGVPSAPPHQTLTSRIVTPHMLCFGTQSHVHDPRPFRASAAAYSTHDHAVGASRQQVHQGQGQR